MRHTRSAPRLGLLAITCVAVLAGCKDNGLRDRNLPLAEAQNRQFRYAVYETTADAPVVTVGGRNWMRSHAFEDIAAHVLVPVGTAAETQLYARRSDQVPYSRLYAQEPDGRWAPWLRVN